MASSASAPGSFSFANLIRPPRLRKGDLIGVVAPASPQRDDERLKSGIRYFESLGYNILPGDNLWKRHGYLAGTDEERIGDLNSMIRDPRVRMIIAGRGGYGVTRLLDRIDYAALRRDPKIIVGFSDLTALGCALLAKSRLTSFSGAMLGVDFWDTGNLDPFMEETFWRSVASPRPLGRIRQPEGSPVAPLLPGRAEGWLLAGNLTLLASITGTPYLPKPNGAILLVEEIGEEAYRVDRLLSQLYNAGMLGKINGLALGAFTGTKPTRVSVDPLPMDEVFGEYIRRAGVPAIGDLLYGHITTKITLPLGVHVKIDGTKGTMQVMEAGVS